MGLKRYREAELTHGRVAMLATIGFLAGEAVEGSSFLFDAQVSGPAITHLSQVPVPFWLLLTIAIGASEQKRATIGWVEPENTNSQLGFIKFIVRPTYVLMSDLMPRVVDEILPVLESNLRYWEEEKLREEEELLTEE